MGQDIFWHWVDMCLSQEKTAEDPRQGPIALAMRKDSKSVLRSGSTSQLAPIQGRVSHAELRKRIALLRDVTCWAL